MNTPAIRQDGMSKAEIAQLLAFIAAYDQRTLGEADVEAWHLLARPGRWRLSYAQRAVIEYATEATGERLLPGHITKRIRSQREHFASTYTHEPFPPHIVGVEAEVDWEYRQVRIHIDTCMDQWAAGGAP